MNKYVPVVVVLALAFLSGSAIQSASAQPLHAREGSVLIFPLFNSTAGNNTLLTVTNTNESESLCSGGSGFRIGDVQLHYTYFSELWAQSDTDENFTPADTLTVLARGHNPNDEMGFVVVEARDPETNFPITFNYLIGSAIVINSEFDFQWSYTPYAFASRGRSDGCHTPIDVPGSDDFDRMDFDDIEYSSFPELVMLDHFFGEGTPAGNPALTFSNTLYLMSTSPGGPEVEDMTEVFVQGYNNNERGFSRTFRFNCYLVTSLNDLTGATTQANLATNGDSGELGGISYGWLKMGSLNRQFTGRGTSFRTHAILGVYAHRVDIGPSSFVAGRELQYTGSRVATLPRTF